MHWYKTQKSKALVTIICVMHMGAVACVSGVVVQLDLWWGVRLILGAVAAASLVRCLRNAFIINAVGKDLDGTWYIRNAKHGSEAPIEVILAGTSVVTNAIMLLNFVERKVRSGPNLGWLSWWRKCRKYSLIICRDSMDADDYRRLKVLLLTERELCR